MRKYLNQKVAIASFISEKQDIELHEWIAAGKSSRLDVASPDMVAMAKWAMHYLVCNPQKPRDYECRFAICPVGFPPSLGDNQHDGTAVGDTESRMELSYIYMREMTGMTVGAEIQKRIRNRLLSYVQDDGLCWCSTKALGKSGMGAMPWTTSLLLRTTMEHYVRTGDKILHKLGRHLVDGLKSLASTKGDKMWYPGGAAAYSDGEWGEACSGHYSVITSALVFYWKATGEDDVLEFAEAMAEGLRAGLQEKLDNTANLDGSHSSTNGHITTRCLIGVAEVGHATGNCRLLEWVRRVYEFNRVTGTDWGWYPENIREHFRRYCSETCFTGDMVEVGATFANAGYPEYWDHIERSIRNYLRETQFFVTPEFEAMYRKINPKRSEREIDLAMRLLRKYEGGFLARLTPNDKVCSGLHMSMMGCCPPEGMRALYIAWANTVVEKGDNVFVNMSLDRDTECAKVRTFAPRCGKLEVEALKGGTFHLRPPSWATQAEVTAYVDGKAVTCEWHQAYIRFRGVEKGDCLRIDYPMPRFTQYQPVGYDGSEDIYHVHWVGNDIEGVSPKGEHLQIFQAKRPTLPPLSDASQWESTEIISSNAESVLSDSDWKPD